MLALRPMDRRTVLKLGASAGALAGAGLYGGYRLLPPGRSRTLEPVDVLARRLFASLDDEQRAGACVDYDHPLRQYHNRGVWGGGLGVFRGFDRAQRALLTDLLYAGLSEAGRERIPEEYFTRWPGVHSMRVLICGDPSAPPYQVILTGAHVNLRLGGKSREGAAFGGPQVYGDQRGNGEIGLPGNLYRYQFLLAQRLLRGLDAGRRAEASLGEAPVQTAIGLQGRGGRFAGTPVASLASEEKHVVRDLIDGILSTYPSRDVVYAQECLAANGGIDALFLAFYAHGEDGPIPEAQVFRLEGPAAVFHFRGHPHVHAFMNVSMDGDAPLSVGELLGNNPTELAGEGVKALFETVLREELGADLAYFDVRSVAGRLRRGPIRSGDIYALEVWQDAVALVEVRGANLSAELRAELVRRRSELVPEKTYTVATTAHVADELAAEKLGRIESRRPGPLLREAAVAHLRTHGFPGARG